MLQLVIFRNKEFGFLVMWIGKINRNRNRSHKIDQQSTNLIRFYARNKLYQNKFNKDFNKKLNRNNS